MRQAAAVFMHESNKAPEIPQVVDEAADTPWWVPVAGAVLLALFALLFVVSQASDSGDEAGRAVPAQNAAAQNAAAQNAAAQNAAARKAAAQQR
jgi:hypothetical protein